jgi:hypothetical protein
MWMCSVRDCARASMYRKRRIQKAVDRGKQIIQLRELALASRHSRSVRACERSCFIWEGRWMLVHTEM